MVRGDTIVLRALLDVSRGRWRRAASAVEELLETGAVCPACRRRRRRGCWPRSSCGAAGPRRTRLVEQAWRLAAPTEELQWVRPAACLRAEAAWLGDDPAGVDEATRNAYETALERGHEWDVGELAIWRWRAGLADEAPPRCAEPYALSIAGDAQAAARAWERTGAPYERALALCDAADPQPALAGLELLDELGAAAPARVVRRRLSALGVRGVPQGPRSFTRAHPAGLSARQAEVLGLVAAGATNAEMAKTLFLTPKTVEHHVTAILRKLRVPDRAAAVEVARREGLAEVGGGSSRS